MQCQFCGKIFEDPKRFEKHQCKPMKRVAFFDENCFKLFKLYQYKTARKKNIERLDYLKSSMFDYFINMKQFLDENLLDASDYFDKMMIFKVKSSQWTTPDSLHRYLVYRNNMEKPEQGIYRSEQYLKSHQLDIMKLDLIQLTTLISDGWLSKHYFISKGIDLRKVLPQEYLREIKDFV